VKFETVVASPVEGYEAITGMWTQLVKPHTTKGAAGVLSWQTLNTWLHERHRAAFHGPIVRAIAEQVWFTDQVSGKRFRYSRATWKEFLKSEFLDPKVEECTVKATGEVKYRLKRLSTEDLSDDEYQAFLMEVQAFGIEWGVEFPEDIPWRMR
jgi:hypothetical protein